MACPFWRQRVVRGYRPVRKLARLGVQTGDWQKAFEKETPSPARRSRFGVEMSEFPRARIVS
jgi:hypothetical protein